MPAHRYQPAHREHAGRHISRRQVLAAMLAGAIAAAAAGVRAATEGHPNNLAAVAPSEVTPSPAALATTTQVAANPQAQPAQVKIDVAQPGPPEVIFNGDPASGAFALTFDDGTCATCAATIVSAIQQSGFHASFSPNGNMGPSVWDSQAEAIAAMAATGQVSLCNHTWSHKDMTRLGAAQVKDELLRNDEWIQQRFGVTSRPFYRPPYGAHDLKSDDIAGSIGFTKVIMWNGTFGDSIVHPPAFILNQLQLYMNPGTIMLGHANHPATASVINEIIDQIQHSGLRPVTLLELLGTNPNPNATKSDRANLITNQSLGHGTQRSQPSAHRLHP